MMTVSMLQEPPAAANAHADIRALEEAEVAHKLELLREVRLELDRELRDGHARLAAARRDASAAEIIPGAMLPQGHSVSARESEVSLPFVAGFLAGGFAILLVQMALG